MTIGPFRDEYAYLSNMFPAPFVLPHYHLDIEMEWLTVEHYYQAAKTINPDEIINIRFAPSGKAAKGIGKNVTLIHDWDNIKIEVMEKGLTEKFKIPILRKRLISTDPEEIVEINHWHDHFWGMCNGHGDNNLGKLLMKIRKHVIQTEQNNE
jgi:ribA/ribD-fused uncharacterized protein